MLNNHRQISAFGETKLVNDQVFLKFPGWMEASGQEEREYLLLLFKQYCRTNLYCRPIRARSKILLKLQEDYTKRYEHAFGHPRAGLSGSFFCGSFDLVWPARMLNLSFRNLRNPARIKKLHNSGCRGLFSFFRREDTDKCFDHLRPLTQLSDIDQIYRAYGEFWNAVFHRRVDRDKKRYWAEKNPMNASNLIFLHKCFKGLKHINMVRHGLNVAYSYRKNYRTGIKYGIDMWARNVEENLKLQYALPADSCINVRYEDLLTDTRATLKKVMDFLGVDFDRKMLSCEVYPEFAHKYDKEIDTEARDYMRGKYSDLLERLGYGVG